MGQVGICVKLKEGQNIGTIIEYPDIPSESEVLRPTQANTAQINPNSSNIFVRFLLWLKGKIQYFFVTVITIFWGCLVFVGNFLLSLAAGIIGVGLAAFVLYWAGRLIYWYSMKH